MSLPVKNVDALEAGPLMDRLIAEFVFGCKWRRVKTRLIEWGIGAGSTDSLRDEDVYCDCPKGIHNRCQSSEHGPALLKLYSSEISAAWEAVENMASKNWMVYIARNTDIGKLLGDPIEGWQPSTSVRICWPLKVKTSDGYHELRRNKEFFANGSTAPLAICRAALKAVTE